MIVIFSVIKFGFNAWFMLLGAVFIMLIGPLFFSLCSQFAQSKTTDGYQLPASDRHAHCKNLLLHQRGAGSISQLPDRDPENYVQPGDV